MIPHRKLERQRQVLVLVKRLFGPTQEPFAERHVGLDFPSLTGKRVIFNAHKDIEREWWERKLVRMSELVLRLDECGTLSPETRFLLNRKVWLNKRRI